MCLMSVFNDIIIRLFCFRSFLAAVVGTGINSIFSSKYIVSKKRKMCNSSGEDKAKGKKLYALLPHILQVTDMSGPKNPAVQRFSST